MRNHKSTAQPRRTERGSRLTVRLALVGHELADLARIHVGEPLGRRALRLEFLVHVGTHTGVELAQRALCGPHATFQHL